MMISEPELRCDRNQRYMPAYLLVSGETGISCDVSLGGLDGFRLRRREIETKAEMFMMRTDY